MGKDEAYMHNKATRTPRPNKIWEIQIGGKVIEGDNPKQFKKLSDRLKKVSKRVHNQRSKQKKG